MPNAIVMNTLTGAVSEYDTFAFDSITPTHGASAAGLFTLTGALDDTAPIVSTVITGKTLLGESVKKRVDTVFFSIHGTGLGQLIVVGKSDRYTYTFPIREAGESRGQPGKGIRENYLAFGFSNPNGDDFELDRIEAGIAKSRTRRT